MAQEAGGFPDTNAIHGYLATEAKQRTARHMRGVVPRMAALLRRPVYSRSRTNTNERAVGCYCHMVKAEN
jgi:hypothetical protein